MQVVDFIPTAKTARAFRDALGCFPTGVTLITIQSAEGPMGFAANSFAAVSLDPPLVLWSPARSSRRFPHYRDASHYAIHVLPENARWLLGRFVSGGPGFDGLSHTVNADGVPVLDEALARFDCERHDTHDGGDHLIIVGRVLRAQYRAGGPLVFSQGRYGQFAPGDDHSSGGAG